MAKPIKVCKNKSAALLHEHPDKTRKRAVVQVTVRIFTIHVTGAVHLHPEHHCLGIATVSITSFSLLQAATCSLLDRFTTLGKAAKVRFGMKQRIEMTTGLSTP